MSLHQALATLLGDGAEYAENFGHLFLESFACH
jgi:hypothetical protein